MQIKLKYKNMENFSITLRKLKTCEESLNRIQNSDKEKLEILWERIQKDLLIEVLDKNLFEDLNWLKGKIKNHLKFIFSKKNSSMHFII
jgi:hypothetical protein